MNKYLFIPCSANPEVLFRAIESIHDQVDTIEVINNTRKPLPYPEKFYDYTINETFPPDALLYGQSLNYAAATSYRMGLPYCLWAHSDIAVKPGAVDALFEKYEEVKDSKWGVIWTNYDSLALFNPKFFVEDGLWDDVLLFPNYFGDNHRSRLMGLRGYGMHNAEKAGPLVHHYGSHTIVMNPSFAKRNDVLFKHHAAIYREIWNGDPGQEKNTDPTVGGIYTGGL